MLNPNCRPVQRDYFYWQRYRSVVSITPELIDHCKELARNGKTPGEIADEIKWPPHVSIRRIVHWVEGIKKVHG